MVFLKYVFGEWKYQMRSHPYCGEKDILQHVFWSVQDRRKRDEFCVMRRDYLYLADGKNVRE